MLCYALIAGMNLLAVGRTTGIVFRWGVPLRTLVAVGTMAVTASGFYRMLVHRASLPLAVLGAVAAAAAVYGGLVLLLGQCAGRSCVPFLPPKSGENHLDFFKDFSQMTKSLAIGA